MSVPRLEIALMMADGIARAKRREELCQSGVRCQRCRSANIQILDVDTQAWKCRTCKTKFRTAIKLGDEG